MGGCSHIPFFYMYTLHVCTVVVIIHKFKHYALDGNEEEHRLGQHCTTNGTMATTMLVGMLRRWRAASNTNLLCQSLRVSSRWYLTESCFTCTKLEAFRPLFSRTCRDECFCNASKTHLSEDHLRFNFKPLSVYSARACCAAWRCCRQMLHSNGEVALTTSTRLW